MPERSLVGRLRTAAGILGGAEQRARAEDRRDVAQAVYELQAALRALILAVESLDRLRASVERQRADAESRAGDEATPRERR